MKTLVAIIKPFRLETVLEALPPLSTRNVNFVEVRGYGRQKGHLDAYEGSELAIDFIPKYRLELEVEDLFVRETIRVICEAARTGRIGDGKIFVMSQAQGAQSSDDRTQPGVVV